MQIDFLLIWNILIKFLIYLPAFVPYCIVLTWISVSYDDKVIFLEFNKALAAWLYTDIYLVNVYKDIHFLELL